MKAASGNMLRLGWLVLLLGLLVAMVRRHGDSPLLWLDTLNDDHLVRGCLEHGECRTRGATVSFGTLVQGGSWHELRAAASSLGLSRTGLHRLLLILDALSLLLIAVAASRLAGIGAAILSVLAWLALNTLAGVPGALLWNYRPVLWMAPILCGLGMRLAVGAGWPTAALAGALSATLAGCHLVGLTLLGPLILIAALMGQGRGRLSSPLALLLAFLALSALSSLHSWQVNLASLGSLGASSPGPAGAGSSRAWLPWSLLLLTALAAWLGPASTRRGLSALFLLALGPLLATLFLGALLRLPTPTTYLTPAFPALAIGFGSGLALLLRRFRQRKRRASPPPAARAASLRAPAAALSLCGLGIALLPAPQTKMIASVPYPSFADVEAAADALLAAGWSREEVFSGLKGPQAPLVIEAVWRHFPSGSRGTRRAFFLPIAASAGPLPAGAKVFGRHALVLVDGTLDWSRLAVCPNCLDSACRKVPLVPAPFEFERLSTTISGMPDFPSGERDPFCMRLPLDDCAAASPGLHLVAVPDADGICRGRLIATPSGGWLSEDGRRALLVTPNAGGEVWIRYQPGGRNCSLENLWVFPPFVFEGPAAQVERMESVLATPAEPGGT